MVSHDANTPTRDDLTFSFEGDEYTLYWDPASMSYSIDTEHFNIRFPMRGGLGEGKRTVRDDEYSALAFRLHQRAYMHLKRNEK